jgi:hypothetical protein
MGCVVSVVPCWQRHDVSILPADVVELGRCLGSQPGANLSMMAMMSGKTRVWGDHSPIIAFRSPISHG